MKPPIKSPYESLEDFQDRQKEYHQHLATIRMAYILAAITGIGLGLIFVALTYLIPR